MVDRKDKTPSKKGLQLYVELYHKNMEAQRSFAAGSEEAPFFPHLNEVYYEKLISLATTGETAALQNFLPNGIFPELISSIGFRNAIIAATEYGNFDTLLVLLSQCTDYSTESGVLIYGSDTPMVIQEAYTIARKADRMELMQFLELFGAKKDYISQADLQLFNENLRTYAFNGDTESLKKLIPLENATHEIVSSEAYKEALCFAADNGHYDAASYLLELERYIVRVDGDYLHIYQAYELALEKQHTRLVGLFGRFAESKGYSLVLPVRNRKSTPTTATEVPAAFREDRAKYQQKLLGLAKTGSAEALQTFLPVSVSPEFFSSTAYRSAIIAATEHGNFDALQVLLARAFDYSKGFDAVVHNSGSSVMQAAYEIAQMADRMDMMQLLELFGAKKDDRSDSERFCEMLLHYASDGDTESLKKLLPLTSFTNEFADSPAYKEALYAAAKNGRYTPVQYFLEGEQRVVRDDGNYSHVQKAYDIAQNMGHSELKPLFRNFAAKMGFTLAIYGGAELPDGNIPEPDIVHYAARGDTMNIKRLLPRLIPQLRTSLSREPLYHRQFRDAVHAATANGHYDTVKYLLGCISSEPADAEPAATAAAAASSLFEEGYNIAQNIQNPRLMGLYKLVALDKHDIELPSIKHLRN